MDKLNMDKDQVLRMIHSLSSDGIEIPPAVLKYLLEFANEVEKQKEKEKEMRGDYEPFV